MPPTSIPDFATTQLALLDLELRAELASTADLAAQSAPASLQRAGLAILNLHVASQRTGLGGKTVLELQRDPAVGGGELPEHGVRTGDIVGVRGQVGGAARKKERGEVERKGVDGVVVRVSGGGVSVALDKEEEDVPAGKLWIMKLANDVTYKRMNQTMTRLKDLRPESTTPLIRILFGHTPPTPIPSSSTTPTTWLTPDLNPSQKSAIHFALSAPEIALIHGPPGTGKTHTLIELILQFLHQGKKLLVCGPSNISVDNIVERLAPHKLPMLRLGHPARLLPSVLNHGLDVQTRTSDAAALVRDVRRELDAKQASIRQTRSGRERREVYAEIRELRREYRERERGCVDGLVRGSRVVLATLHGAGGYQLRGTEFDVVVVDEAGQALEAQCWVPLLGARKAVLAGDHLQLPPTVKSASSKSGVATQEKPNTGINGEAAAAGEGRKEISDIKFPKDATLETTLFDRLLALHGPRIKRMLTTQYRMHASIMSYPSSSLYSDELVADASVASHLLYQLPHDPPVRQTEDTTSPLVFYDTQGGDFPEKAEDALDDSSPANSKKKKSITALAESKSNDLEAALVLRHVRALLSAGVREDDVAVIAPYNAQVALLGGSLRERHPGVELGSVDGFQGREKEAVVLSLVRSNPAGEVGFLGDRRRLNVAMTRPRRHLCITGDSETVGRGSPFLKRWMRHLEENADLRYPDPSDVLSPET